MAAEGVPKLDLSDMPVVAVVVVVDSEANGQPLAIGTKDYAGPQPSPRWQSESEASGPRVPNSHTPVEAGRGQQSPVRVVRQAEEPVAVLSKGEQSFSRAGVPDAGVVVGRTRGEASPVGAVRHRVDAVGVAVQRQQWCGPLLCRGRVTGCRCCKGQ